MTYDQLRRDIELSTGNTTEEFLASIDSFIRQAENMIALSVTLPVADVTAPVTLTAGQETVTLPSDFESLDHLSIPGYGSLEKKRLSFIREAYPDSSEQGTPRYVAQRDSTTLVIAPVPSATIKGELGYKGKPTSITATTNRQNGTYISNRFETALLQGALMFSAIWMQNPDAKAMYQEQALSALGLTKTFADGRLNRQSFEKANAAIQGEN